MAKKTHRINGQEVCVKASNAVYNGSISDVDNAQAAIDNLDERVADIENGGGGGSVVVEVDGLPMTNNDPVAYDLQQVFEKTFASDELPGSSVNWQFQLSENNCLANEAVVVTQGETFKLVIEVQSSRGTLGENGLYIHWRNIFGRTNSYSSLTHVYDGVKDIYSCTATVSSSTASRRDAATGTTQFKIPSVQSGDTIRVASYVEYNGTRFFFKKCTFSAVANGSDVITLPYSLEWDSTATTPNKVRALIDNHMLPMCSAGSEYDPFVQRNTTPRVLVTIMSDDGGTTDYSGLRTLLKAKQDAYNEENPTTPVEIGWTVAIPSNLVPWNENNAGDSETGIYDHRMTARTLRELVANNRVSIMSHGYNHVKFDGNISTEQCELEAVNSKRQLEREIGVPCIHYCLPGGTSNTNHLAVLYGYFLSVATTEPSPHDDAHYSENTNYPNRLVQTDPRIRRFSCDSLAYPTAPGDRHIGCIQAAQTYVTQNGKSAWIVFYTHSHEFNKCVPSGSGTNNPYTHGQNIAAIVDYCLENGIPLVNYSEAYAEMFPPVERLKDLLGLNS